MIKDVHSKGIEQLFKTPVLQQTAYWSKVKSHFGYDSVAFNFRIKHSILGVDGTPDSSEYAVADLVVFLRRIDSLHYIAYVPYGPEIEPGEEFQGAVLEELSEQLRHFLPKTCIMIRYDLVWESLWSNDSDLFNEERTWLGPPSHRIQEQRFNFNTILGNFRKAYSNNLPSNTILVNLKRDSQTILSDMKPKTRYNIQLSQKRGVYVRSAGLESLSVWYDLYKETALRNNFYLHSEEYFRVAFTERAHNTQSPAEVTLLIAEYDKLPLAAMFLVISGNRAIYLYGASSSLHRNLMAPYALQWKAISLAKEKGCIQYDMFGISPGNNPDHPMYGLYRFKKGFGGTLFHSMGCWDYPLDQKMYLLYTASEIGSQGYHLA
jgi:lipid II:glycine glycyltransferase (peptidoglycan interpeptide bridge formation enzyme)